MKHVQDETNQGRFIAASIDKTTGCHQLLFKGASLTYSNCIYYCQAAGPVEQHRHRMLFKAHADNGEEELPVKGVEQTPVLTLVTDK